MSVYRTLVRLAVVSALNNYMRVPWPTLAGPNIFDSKIEPVEDMKHDRAFPCCVVYTDYDKDHWPKAKLAHSDRFLTITLELMIVQAQREIAGDERYTLDCPQTDSEIETSLDVFEAQIFRALTANTIAAEALSYLCPGILNVVSRRGATYEGSYRLAARQVTAEMKTLREPAAGVIPTAIEAFLKELEAHEDYAARVHDIRLVLTASASDTEAQRTMRAFGYGGTLMAQLGGVMKPNAVLPPKITYHWNGER